MEFSILWFALIGLVVGIARARGRSLIGWFFIAIVATPPLALVALVLLPKLSGRADDEAESGRHHAPQRPRRSRSEHLAHLEALRAAGDITTAEYETAKVKVMERG